MKFLIIFSVFIIFSGCVSKERENELLNKISELETKLDECENGAERLIAKLEKSYSEKDYTEAKKYIQILKERHPESHKNKEFENLLKKIEKAEKFEKKRKEAEEKERIRLANLNNTGMWSVGHYVDKFGEPTKQGYITNTDKIRGTFSNTATQDSRLNVDFLISNSYDIDIQLYEYAGNNPVKAYSSDNYYVYIQDKDKRRYELKASNYSDRLSFSKTESRKVHKILLKGGLIKFRIVEIETPTTYYEFNILNANYYENAYRKLTK